MSNDGAEYTEEEDQIPACPDCDSGSVSMNSTGGPSRYEDPDTYRCSDCYATFDDPNHRDRRGPGGLPGNSLAAALSDADPSEVGRGD